MCLKATLEKYHQSKIVDWPDETKSMCLGEYLPPEVTRTWLNDYKKSRHFCREPIIMRHLEFESDLKGKQYSDAAKRISGALHPLDFVQHEDQVLRNPGDGTYGVGVWTTNSTFKDFVIIGTLPLQNQDILKILKDQTVEATALPTRK